MENESLKELLLRNRSYRGYDQSREITREELEDMVDCVRYAPSSVNVQPLQYYLACDKETVQRLQPLTKWARGLPELNLPYPGHCPTAFIVICQNKDWADSIPRFQRDVGIVAHTILLRAVEMGLGGCMIGNYEGEAVAGALKLPEQLTPVLIVAIGKPDETIVITGVEDGKTNYYRDENGVHYVPKRALKEILINP